MSKVSIGLFFIIGFVLGFNAGGQGNTLKYLWDENREGLKDLNQMMKADKSERLAAVFFTQEKRYHAMAFDSNKLYLDCAIKPVPEDQLESHWKKMHGIPV